MNAYFQTKAQISCTVSVFATRIVQSPYFLNPKCSASSYLLSLHSTARFVSDLVSEIPMTGFLTAWLICSKCTDQLSLYCAANLCTVQYESHDRAVPEAPDLPRQKSTFIS